MKKLISKLLAVAALLSAMTVPAFAAETPITSTDASGHTIYVSDNSLNNEVLPLSEAPEMDYTFTFNDVVFSNYLKRESTYALDADGNRVFVCRVEIGLNGAMKSNRGDVEFIAYPRTFNIVPNHLKGYGADSDLVAYKTNTPYMVKKSTTSGETYSYLDELYITPYSDSGRAENGTWDTGLTWKFEQNPAKIRSNGSYLDIFYIRVDHGTKVSYFEVRVTDGTNFWEDRNPASDQKPAVDTPAAAPALKSFSDVSASRWSHDAIMEMVDLGMFSGTTTPDKNGIARFDPTGTMTRAQFITVVAKYLYGDELSGIADYGSWYAKYFDTAVKHGLIQTNEFNLNTLNAPITREEMALIAVRVTKAQGETIPTLVGTDRIADYAAIGSYYKDSVRQAFSMGLISGYDDKGTFGPKDTLTREQGAMVAYKLVAPESRTLPGIDP